MRRTRRTATTAGRGGRMMAGLGSRLLALLLLAPPVLMRHGDAARRAGGGGARANAGRGGWADAAARSGVLVCLHSWVALLLARPARIPRSAPVMPLRCSPPARHPLASHGSSGGGVTQASTPCWTTRSATQHAPGYQSHHDHHSRAAGFIKVHPHGAIASPNSWRVSCLKLMQPRQVAVGQQNLRCVGPQTSLNSAAIRWSHFGARTS